MRRILIPSIVLACLACAERSAPMSAILPSVEDVCIDYCEVSEICWHDEILPNPFPTVDACVAECLDLDAAWADDPWGRPECADLIGEMRRCYISYEPCVAFDDAQLEGGWGPDPGDLCAEEVQAVFVGDCDMPDPRNDP